MWEAFQALVEDRGRTKAAEVLEMNSRTVAANLEAGRLSRRMRAAVQRFENEAAEAGADAETAGPAGAEVDEEPRCWR